MPSQARQRRVPALRHRSPKEPVAPEWLSPPVPHGFWNSLPNRRRYMRWLGQRLGFRKPEDWYHVTTDDFKHNFGATPLLQNWQSSAVVAVKEAFPDRDWKEWLFDMAPLHFWHDLQNRRRYMRWLGEQLGFRTPADWYRVTNEDFRDHKGGAFLLRYHSTISAAVMDYLPEHDWKEWLFAKTPKEFWLHRKNRRRYMQWLAARLGFSQPHDWYCVTTQHFRDNCGGELLKKFGGVPAAVVMDAFPRRKWHDWMFAKVPIGFWERPENRLRYVEWLGQRLRIKRREDWDRIRQKDIRDNCGGALLARYSSYRELLADCVPRLYAN